MTALVLSPWSPADTGGAAVRVHHVAAALAAERPTEVLALGPQAGPLGPEPYGGEVVAHRPRRSIALLRSARRPYLEALVRSHELADRAAAGRWDLVVVESPFLVAAAVRAAAGAPVVLDAHNVEADIAATLARTDHRRLARLRWRWEAAKDAAAERRAVAQVDAVLATSADDAATLGALGAQRVEVVANGVDVAAVEHRLPPRSAVLAYVGSYGYRPNEQAALELVDEVLPLVRERRSDAAALVIGREPTPALLAPRPHVEVTGPVASVLDRLRAARVLVVPLRAGSGTRLKVLEAMAAGTPVVATPLAVAGLDLAPGEQVLVGERPEDLARLATEVVADDALAARLSRAARRTVEERFDWRATTEPLRRVVAELDVRRPGPTGP